VPRDRHITPTTVITDDALRSIPPPPITRDCPSEAMISTPSSGLSVAKPPNDTMLG
jgi:hypothetical protein